MSGILNRIPIVRRVAWKIRSRSETARRVRDFTQQLDILSPVRIVIGASGTCPDGWIATEIDLLDIRDERQWRRLFAPNSIDALLAEHVWEHLTKEDGLLAARHCYRFLKPGGYLRVAVPDGFHSDPEYIEWVRVGGTGLGADDHKVLYNCDTLRSLFEKAGFDVQLQEYFDASGVFHAADWKPEDGMIRRSLRYDKRNPDGQPHYTSIIVDAHKSSCVKPN